MYKKLIKTLYSFICRGKSFEQKEELTLYINKIFEQQEKERIVRWLVNSIRESLELEKVLDKTVQEIEKLLKVDKCEIKLIENGKKEGPTHDNRESSIISVPIIDKEQTLGFIYVYQSKHKKKLEEAHIDVLKDIGSQIAIAIRQAILYKKVQETTRLKSEFLSGMSHELRTPLNAIIGFSDMLITEDYGSLSEKQRKFLKNISMSGEHLLKLVNDILDLSKIESNNLEVNYEAFNIYHAINETVSVLQGLADRKSISININVYNDIFLNADLRRFKQIMYNLLSNAIKFTEEGGEINIKAYQKDVNLRVEVKDNGIGISSKDRKNLFKSFRQLDSSLARKQEGTGLGLALTKKLIELHKGTIDFESKEGKGSTFWFTLPGIFSQKVTS